MPNPYVFTTEIATGPVTFTFQIPTLSDRMVWEAIAEGKPEERQEKVAELLLTLLKGNKIDGETVLIDLEALKESGLLSGPNGIGVGVTLFRFCTVEPVIHGLEGHGGPGA